MKEIFPERAGSEMEMKRWDERYFGIYQLKREESLREIRFMPLRYLVQRDIAVARANYELVYVAPSEDGMDLEEIYFKFNTAHPEDFVGHSLSVSDVIVLNREGDISAHYVDSFGFRLAPIFVKEAVFSMENRAIMGNVSKEKEGTK